jgi:RNA polymerase sporulation-specific sigma factor
VIDVLEVQKNNNLLNDFIAENINLVHYVIKTYLSYVRRGDDNYDDFFQEGCIGLMKAVERYDPSKGIKFSTYAVPIIWGAMKRLDRDFESSPLIKVSRELKSIYYQQLGLRNRNVSDELIPEILKISADKINAAITAMNCVSSLNDFATHSSDGDKTMTLEDVLPSDTNIENLVVNNIDMQNKVDNLWKVLNDRDYRIFKLYLQNKKQDVIGRTIGLSQVQVSRILTRISERARVITEKMEVG